MAASGGGQAGGQETSWPVSGTCTGTLAPCSLCAGSAFRMPLFLVLLLFTLWLLLPSLLCWFFLITRPLETGAPGAPSLGLFSVHLPSFSDSIWSHSLNTIHMLMVPRFKFPARTLTSGAQTRSPITPYSHFRGPHTSHL